MLTPTAHPRLAVLASGEGSNLQALIDAEREGRLGATIVLVVSDRPEARALTRARSAGIEAVHLDPDAAARGRVGPAFVARLLEHLDARRVEFVALAGFMRILSPPIVQAYRWRLLNIHPSLLPAFPGRDAIRQALEHGVKVSGCTVHFVDEGMDTGPIVLQEAVPVYDDDDEQTLKQRIQAVEHRLYPRAVSLLAQGRLRVEGRRVRILPAAERSIPS